MDDYTSLPSSFLYDHTSLSRPTTAGGHCSRPGSQLSGFADFHISVVPANHLQPIPKSAVRKWKRLHEIDMFDRLVRTKDDRRIRDRETLQRVTNIARRIPVDLLAKEWLNKESATIEAREYLIEQLLPCLILGLEKLLQEVTRRNLADQTISDDGYCANFNPINFLAQYLMRNNPRYSNFSEASPYIRGLREISDELRQKIYHFNNNKLALIKAEARRRREERQLEENRKKNETSRRMLALQGIFDMFLLAGEVKIDRQAIIGSIVSFQNILERLPEELKANSAIKFHSEVAEKMTRKVIRKDFVDELMDATENVDSEIFDRFVEHLATCARSYKSLLEKDERGFLFSNLFVTCDLDQIGILDRPRIIELFTKFYEENPTQVQDLLQNPSELPLRNALRDVKKLKRAQRRHIRQQRAAAIKAGEEAPVDLEEPSDDSSFEEEVAMKQPEMKPDEQSAKNLNQSNITLQGNNSNLSFEADASMANTISPTDDKHSSSSPVLNEDLGNVNGNVDIEKEKIETEIVTDLAIKEKSADDVQLQENEEGVKEILKEESELEDAKSEIVIRETSPEILEQTDLVENEVNIVGDEMGEEKVKLGLEQAEETVISESKSPVLVYKSNKLKHGKDKEEFDAAIAKGLSFVREKTNFSLISEMTQFSQASTYDEKNINESQFMQLIETFLSVGKSDMKLVRELVSFIQGGYQESEAERMARMMEAHRLAVLSHRKLLIDRLFELWDNDGSGYLEVDEVESILKKYKSGSYNRGIASAKRILTETKVHDTRLTRREFQDFLFVTLQRIRREDDMEALIEFLEFSIQRTHMEQARGDARKKFLQTIAVSAYTGGGSIEPVYRAVFQALYKDAEAHGDHKFVSANFAMLEPNLRSPERGNTYLRYAAATPNDMPFMIGRIIYRDIPNISFKAVDTGRPFHVPRAINNSSVNYFNPQRKDEQKTGAVVIVPIKDNRKRVFGIMEVDTLDDPRANTTSFSLHEIQFYEGVARSFSNAFAYVDRLKKAVRVGESALSWMCRRINTVCNAIFYMQEKDFSSSNKRATKSASRDYILRRMLATDSRGEILHSDNPPSFKREDNLFKNYLFEVIDTSEPVIADAYGERHLALPLRDLDGRADVVIDIGIGNLKYLPTEDHEDVNRIMALLQLAYEELLRNAEGDAANLEPGLTNRTEQMFSEMMLNDLAQNVHCLDAQVYAEMKSYHEPPQVVHCIVQAILGLFYPERARNNEFQDWDACRPLVGVDLGVKIVAYNPIKKALTAPLDIINPLLADVPFNLVEKHGSKPAQQLFNWVVVCITLIEHTLKLMQSRKDSIKDTQPNEEGKPQEPEVSVEGTNLPKVPEIDES